MRFAYMARIILSGISDNVSYVLPSSPSPCTRLSLAQSTTLDPPPHSYKLPFIQFHRLKILEFLADFTSAPSTVSGCTLSCL